MIERYISCLRSYIGVCWVEQGRSLSGIDCVGLLVCAAKDYGVEVEDPRTYNARRGSPTELKSLLRVNCSSKGLSQKQVGDIVIVGDAQTHVGVLTDSYQPFGFIHVPIDARCVEVRFDPLVFVIRNVFRPWIFN